MNKTTHNRVDLETYDASRHDPGAGLLKRILWYWVNALVFDSWLFPVSGIKRVLLRIFGGKIGKGVVVKPRVNIKYPWKLSIGDCTWIGEGVWIDNVGDVQIGSNCCISQGAYLCTGNHDWSDPGFRLIVEPIRIAEQVWIGAFSTVCPGLSVADGAVLTAGSVLTRDADPWTIYAGAPAVPVKKREVSEGVQKISTVS